MGKVKRPIGPQSLTFGGHFRQNLEEGGPVHQSSELDLRNVFNQSQE